MFTLIIFAIIITLFLIIGIIKILLKPFINGFRDIDEDNWRFAKDKEKPNLTYALLTIPLVILFIVTVIVSKNLLVNAYWQIANDIPSVETPYTEYEEAEFQKKIERYKKIDKFTNCAIWQCRAYNLRMKMISEGFGSGLANFIYQKTNTNRRLREMDRMQVERLKIIQEKKSKKAQKKAEKRQKRESRRNKNSYSETPS